MQLKAYLMRGSPPSYAVLATLTSLKVPFTTIYIDYMGGEHLKEEHTKRNPQREVPVLDDNGFLLSESVAIMQYVCEKFGDSSKSTLYPRDPQQRAIVNHRLMFNVVSFYPSIGNHTFGAIFGMTESADSLRDKALKALSVFETILSQQNTRFVAGDNVTIADIAVSTAALCMEAANFDMSPYPTINRWYQTFKKECPELWNVVKGCRDDLHEYIVNPPPKKAFEKLDELRKK